MPHESDETLELRSQDVHWTDISHLSSLKPRSYPNGPLVSSKTGFYAAIRACLAAPTCRSCSSSYRDGVTHGFHAAPASAPTNRQPLVRSLRLLARHPHG